MLVAAAEFLQCLAPAVLLEQLLCLLDPSLGIVPVVHTTRELAPNRPESGSHGGRRWPKPDPLI